MYKNKNVIYPNQLTKDMKIEKEIFPAIESDLGIVTISHQINSKHVLRIYQLLLNDEQDRYEIVQELVHFTFEDRNELVYFLDDLPHLNGLEMLILLNPLPQSLQT